MAMTVLYGLEMLNDDDGWTRKHMLRVHIIGASAMEANSVIFEEILHHLPQVKILKVCLILPLVHTTTVLQGVHPARSSNIQEHVADTTSSYKIKAASSEARSLYCLQFRASVVSTHTWLPTLKLLVEVIQSRRSGGEAALFRPPVPSYIPPSSPLESVGSIKLGPSAHKVYGFDSDNGWLAGGFR
ncbi:hypothetical protein B0H14DRAFT_3511912 [Mycena olivaceomarginata]|nr:hypothetical protein B0H14DRAFT_3511912 [Mycena olivaceomarginata]